MHVFGLQISVVGADSAAFPTSRSKALSLSLSLSLIFFIFFFRLDVTTDAALSTCSKSCIIIMWCLCACRSKKGRDLERHRDVSASQEPRPSRWNCRKKVVTVVKCLDTSNNTELCCAAKA